MVVYQDDIHRVAWYWSVAYTRFSLDWNPAGIYNLNQRRDLILPTSEGYGKTLAGPRLCWKVGVRGQDKTWYYGSPYVLMCSLLPCTLLRPKSPVLAKAFISQSYNYFPLRHLPIEFVTVLVLHNSRRNPSWFLHWFAKPTHSGHWQVIWWTQSTNLVWYITWIPHCPLRPWIRRSSLQERYNSITPVPNHLDSKPHADK